jgi:hypothetical protein
MDQSSRDRITAMHDAQRQRAATYKPNVPEVPTAHGCAGDCSTPPPPPPISNELFRSGPTGIPREWWLLMGSASVIYLLLCLRTRRA